MERSELVRRLVLDEICNDYENVDQCILGGVASGAAKFGFDVDRPEIIKALAQLVTDGYARAYLLSSREPFLVKMDGMPLLDAIEVDFKTYFLATKKGLEFTSTGSTNF